MTLHSRKFTIQCTYEATDNTRGEFFQLYFTGVSSLAITKPKGSNVQNYSTGDMTYTIETSPYLFVIVCFLNFI